jgi:mannosyltransferase OCH1-like enzyme
MLIPKIIHTSWKSKDLLDSDSILVSNGIARLVNLNPNWQFNIYVDEEIDQYLFENLDKTEYSLIKDEHIVAKLDIWRLMKLYTEGGMYVDVDRYCNVVLDEVINTHSKCVLPISKYYDFSQDIMISAPENPIYMLAFQLNMSARHQGNRNTYYLGPQTYMHAVTKILTGKSINTNPGKQKMSEIAEIIKKIDFMQTYIEHSPTDTFLFRHKHKSELKDWETHKRALYASYGLKHWTNEW